MNINDYLDEFATDWRLDGRAATTVELYAMHVRRLVADRAETGEVDQVTLLSVKDWLADSPSAQTARMRGRAVRAFGKWACANDGPQWDWWEKVPLSSVALTPQPTATHADYGAAKAKAGSVRDRLVIELLWCTGLRVSELARVNVDDVSLVDGSVLVQRSKTGRPRLAPLSDGACRLIRRLPKHDQDPRLLGMTSGAIQQLLKRLQCPSAHAWRRGWAIEALRSGVSETSVKAAAGWSSGAMVARYTSAASGELAISEFRNRSNRGLH